MGLYKGYSQNGIPKVKVTVSPIIDTTSESNKKIIKTLELFLNTKDNSLTENLYWLPSDFNKFKYPYFDLYQIEKSKYGGDFYKPTLMEIISTEVKNEKIVKVAFIGHRNETNENMLKAIYNMIAVIHEDKVFFSKYTNVIDNKWNEVVEGTIKYKISPLKNINTDEVERQRLEVLNICKFFNSQPIEITYYSCVNPQELFNVKGFDYNSTMYMSTSGGYAEYGKFIYSANNSEYYTHEVVHIYTHEIFPNINVFFDEGIATYFGGSGNQSYKWHRQRLLEYISENPTANFDEYIDIYKKIYIKDETPIPYITAALICERILRLYGKEKLFEIFRSTNDTWEILNSLNIDHNNLNEIILEEINLPLHEYK